MRQTSEFECLVRVDRLLRVLDELVAMEPVIQSSGPVRLADAVLGTTSNDLVRHDLLDDILVLAGLSSATTGHRDTYPHPGKSSRRRARVSIPVAWSDLLSDTDSRGCSLRGKTMRIGHQWVPLTRFIAVLSGWVRSSK